MPGTVRYRILPDIASCRPGQLACWLELAELCRAFEIDVKLPRAARSGLNHRDPRGDRCSQIHWKFVDVVAGSIDAARLDGQHCQQLWRRCVAVGIATGKGAPW